ncbi:hypothetical protein NCAS_0A03290 [Naumovozyma castellii]|uniref:Uncharacterized protein n=1 Tax=Naumovozyma castellii TaxID=27288 RepID=G0V5Z7_NAUCA|nr:hypothetical protein NCAS_0A03290 [Naumovozyma castellii CBS 4309]CCC66887.1 hypothetical protein NCAS_0A03290 [Naumovozyma castellii CBS 4309]
MVEFVVRDPPKKVIESDEPLSKDVIRAVIASGCSYTNCPEILTNIHRKRTVVRSLAVGPEMVCEECGYFCFEVGGERYEIEMPIIKNNGFDLISITDHDIIIENGFDLRRTEMGLQLIKGNLVIPTVKIGKLSYLEFSPKDGMGILKNINFPRRDIRVLTYSCTILRTEDTEDENALN